MKKLIMSILSLTLVSALVLALGVCAFADNAEATETGEIEIVDIAFDLSSEIPLAVRMRALGYDDICLNGISYRTDAEDGVISVCLGDLAMAKLLTEKRNEAESGGISLDKIYIANGMIHVKDDIGLSAEEISALEAAISELLTAYRIPVTVGDIFDLSNGDEVKLRLRVAGFYYSQTAQTDEKTDVSHDTEEKTGMPIKGVEHDKAEQICIDRSSESKEAYFDTPQITTVYVSYMMVRIYSQCSGDSNGTYERKDNDDTTSFIFIANAADDENEYYINRNAVDFYKFENVDYLKITIDPEEAAMSESVWIKAGNATKALDYDSKANLVFAYFNDMNSGIDLGLTKQLLISADGGKTVCREINFVYDTPTPEELMQAYYDDELDALGYTCNTDMLSDGKIYFIPIEPASPLDSTGEPATVICRDVVIIKDVETGEVEQVQVMALSMLGCENPAAVNGTGVEESEDKASDDVEPLDEPVNGENTDKEPVNGENINGGNDENINGGNDENINGGNDENSKTGDNNENSEKGEADTAGSGEQEGTDENALTEEQNGATQHPSEEKGNEQPQTDDLQAPPAPET